MWIQIHVLVCVILAYPCYCSLVIDRPYQEGRTEYQGINIKDYCPKMQHCPEGSHTMCLYFNPHQIAGPRCSGFQNLSMTPEISELLLDYVNEVRGRVSNGTKETIQGNVLIPRGYGLFKLKWDEELATFAQVLANSCILRHDLCRATKRFSNPAQVATIVRFSMPDWVPISNRSQLKEKGLNQAKINYAITEAYKSWYRQKNFVTLQMLQKVPDWLAQPSNTEGKQFLEIIGGDVTHMGCGISAYVEFHYQYSKKNEKYETIFNTIHIVCNLSANPKIGKPVYRTTRPSIEELCPRGDQLCKRRYNSKCGCPPGTDEDDRCLCTDPITYPPTPTCGKEKNCKPAVVLLPIFTVEDAPEHMITRTGLSDGTGSDPMYDDAPYNSFNSRELEHNEVLENRRRHHFAQTLDHSQDPTKVQCHHKHQSTSFIMNSLEPPFSKKRITDLRNYHSEQQNEENQEHSSFDKQMRNQHSSRILPQRRSPLTSTGKKNRASIFSRAPKFDLHNNFQTKAAVKMDVAPRRDFSKAKQALDEYLNEKKKNSQQSTNNAAQHFNHDEVVDEHQNEPSTAKPTLSIKPRFKSMALRSKHRDTAIEHSNINFTKSNTRRPKSNKHLKNKFRNLGFNTDDEAAGGYQMNNNNAIEGSDKKLMSLLDNLEQEAKHVDFGGTEKEVFDVKLKKIYGSVVRKPVIPVSNKNRHELKEYTHSDFIEDGLSDLEQEREEKHPYLHDSVHKNLKVNTHTGFEEEIYPNYQLRREKNLKYRPELDEPMLFDSTNDPNQIELDEQMYDTKDMINNLHSNGVKASQSLYARPLPRDQNTLRPTMEKMDYVFRNTFNDVHDVKSKTPKKNYRGYQRFRSSDYSRIRGNSHRVKDKVKVLPYHLQYKKNENRDKYRILNKYNAMRNKHTNLRSDDEKGTDLNRIDEKRTRYDDEIMSDDYVDDRQVNYNIKNGKRYEDNYERDKEYQEDPLSAERRKFYQEKLDNIENSKYSANEGNSRDTVRRRSPHGKHILGIRRNRSNRTQHFYVPNRASRHNV